MVILYKNFKVKQVHKGSIILIGNFDGVHLGHQKLFKLAKLYKKNLNVFKDLITFVKDRPGHDLRYSLNSSKIKKKLHWKPLYSFNKGINLTIDWYIKNYEKEKD